MRGSTKLLVGLGAAGLVAAGGAAFTSTNTIGSSSAGEGTSAIGTYSTSNVQYDANETDPTQLDAVRFTLDKPARYVAIRTHASGDWYRSDDLRLNTGTDDSCTSSNNIDWTCDVTGNGETVLGADSLSVVATS